MTFVTFLLRHAKSDDERTTAAAQQLAQMWPDVLSGLGTNGGGNGATANSDALTKVRSAQRGNHVETTVAYNIILSVFCRHV